MNDFTKDELRKLLHGLGLINDIPCMVLENKIQSLIDNYCEHEWINIHEKLPEHGQHVIAYCQNYPNNFVSMVRFEKGKDSYYFWNDSIDQKGNVIFWMPLPQPPE